MRWQWLYSTASPCHPDGHFHGTWCSKLTAVVHSSPTKCAPSYPTLDSLSAPSYLCLITLWVPSPSYVWLAPRSLSLCCATPVPLHYVSLLCEGLTFRLPKKEHVWPSCHPLVQVRASPGGSQILGLVPRLSLAGSFLEMFPWLRNGCEFSEGSRDFLHNLSITRLTS